MNVKSWIILRNNICTAHNMEKNSLKNVDRNALLRNKLCSWPSTKSTRENTYSKAQPLFFFICSCYLFLKKWNDQEFKEIIPPIWEYQLTESLLFSIHSSGITEYKSFPEIKIIIHTALENTQDKYYSLRSQVHLPSTAPNKPTLRYYTASSLVLCSIYCPSFGRLHAATWIAFLSKLFWPVFRHSVLLSLLASLKLPCSRRGEQHNMPCSTKQTLFPQFSGTKCIHFTEEKPGATLLL